MSSIHSQRRIIILTCTCRTMTLSVCLSRSVCWLFLAHQHNLVIGEHGHTIDRRVINSYCFTRSTQHRRRSFSCFRWWRHSKFHSNLSSTFVFCANSRNVQQRNRVTAAYVSHHRPHNFVTVYTFRHVSFMHLTHRHRQPDECAVCHRAGLAQHRMS